MRVLKRGDFGLDVAEWQRILKITADGIFGEQTELAMKAWQTAHSLVPDGIVGELSWAAAARGSTDRPSSEHEILRGIDVSAIQGELTDADWQAIAASGIRFAWLRGVVGNEYRDAKLLQNVERAKRAGIVPGAYVFPFPLPHLDPKRQAEFFVSLLEGIGTNVGELPIAFDLEWPPPEQWAKWKCMPLQMAEWFLACLERGEALTGHKWVVYLYRYIWSMIFKGAPDASRAIAKGRRLWLADYRLAGKVPTPEQAHATKPPVGWDAITCVQYDGDGGLKLPNGRDADFNVLLGGEAHLAELAGGVSEAGGTADTLPNLATIMASIAASRLTIDGAIVEDSIAAYRRDRTNA